MFLISSDDLVSCSPLHSNAFLLVPRFPMCSLALLGTVASILAARAQFVTFPFDFLFVAIVTTASTRAHCFLVGFPNGIPNLLIRQFIQLLESLEPGHGCRNVECHVSFDFISGAPSKAKHTFRLF